MEEKYIYYNNLYDIYSELLTLKEQETFSLYYQEDLSLSEIADNNNISKSAVGKMIKTILEKLDNYERILKNYQRQQQLLELLKEENITIIKMKINKILNG